jgi:hypothetical protein
LLGESLVLTSAGIALFALLGVALVGLAAILIKGIVAWANYETATE